MLLERFNLREKQDLLAEKYGEFSEIDAQVARLQIDLAKQEQDFERQCNKL